LQWWVIGHSVLAVVLLEAAIGWLLVEFQMAEWHRVPFTCSYIPGKGFVPQMCVKAFAAYVTFTLATGIALRVALRDQGVALVMALVVSAAAAALRIRRARHARRTSLLFEEQLPTELTPLRLNTD
jgi:hypothetical protein